VETLRGQLAAIGISVKVALLRQGASPSRWDAVLAHADMALVARNAGEADDAVEYLLHLPYLPAAERTQLDRLATVPPPRREAVAARVAAKLEQDAVYVGLADAATPELVSKRLGCVIDQSEYPGIDLAALCLGDRSR